ncbi:hypothetical protein [uncultured Sphingomonas sp.]|uniref:hypothetical protein n=1 Tax=uncultured Sphingomonas sp. TaxID=158754 RepID=UPI002596097B|nr:hypothetical protein [uncultured Sphingomonas sp.]
MNSSENNLFDQLLENSGSAIKRDLRGCSKRSAEVQLLAQIIQESFASRVEQLERRLYSDRERFAASLREAMEPCNYHGAGALGLVNHNIDRLVGRDVDSPRQPQPAAAGIAWYEGALTHEGLRDKIVVVAPRGVRVEWLNSALSQLAAAPELVVFVTPRQYQEFVGVGVAAELMAVIDEFEPVKRQFTCDPLRAGHDRRGKGKRSAFNRAERWR